MYFKFSMVCYRGHNISVLFGVGKGGQNVLLLSVINLASPSPPRHK